MTLILMRTHDPLARDFLSVGALSDENVNDNETAAGLKVAQQLNLAIRAESRGGELANEGESGGGGSAGGRPAGSGSQGSGSNQGAGSTGNSRPAEQAPKEPAKQEAGKPAEQAPTKETKKPTEPVAREPAKGSQSEDKTKPKTKPPAASGDTGDDGKGDSATDTGPADAAGGGGDKTVAAEVDDAAPSGTAGEGGRTAEEILDNYGKSAEGRALIEGATAVGTEGGEHATSLDFLASIGFDIEGVDRATADQVVGQIASGDLSSLFQVEIDENDEVLGTATDAEGNEVGVDGAFIGEVTVDDESGDISAGTVLISGAQVQEGAGEEILSREIGHALDAAKGGAETQGDEGDIVKLNLQAQATGEPAGPDALAAARAEDDKVFLTPAGAAAPIEVEAQTSDETPLEPPGARHTRAFLDKLHKAVSNKFVEELAAAEEGTPANLLFKLLEARHIGSQDPFWTGKVDLGAVERDIAKLLRKPAVHGLLAKAREEVLSNRGQPGAKAFAQTLGDYVSSDTFLDWAKDLPEGNGVNQQGGQVADWLGFVHAYDHRTGQKTADNVLKHRIAESLDGKTVRGNAADQVPDSDSPALTKGRLLKKFNELPEEVRGQAIEQAIVPILATARFGGPFVVKTVNEILQRRQGGGEVTRSAKQLLSSSRKLLKGIAQRVASGEAETGPSVDEYVRSGLEQNDIPPTRRAVRAFRTTGAFIGLASSVASLVLDARGRPDADDRATGLQIAGDVAFGVASALPLGRDFAHVAKVAWEKVARPRLEEALASSPDARETFANMFPDAAPQASPPRTSEDGMPGTSGEPQPESNTAPREGTTSEESESVVEPVARTPEDPITTLAQARERVDAAGDSDTPLSRQRPEDPIAGRPNAPPTKQLPTEDWTPAQIEAAIGGAVEQTAPEIEERLATIPEDEALDFVPGSSAGVGGEATFSLGEDGELSLVEGDGSSRPVKIDLEVDEGSGTVRVDLKIGQGRNAGGVSLDVPLPSHANDESTPIPRSAATEIEPVVDPIVDGGGLAATEAAGRENAEVAATVGKALTVGSAGFSALGYVSFGVASAIAASEESDPALKGLDIASSAAMFVGALGDVLTIAAEFAGAASLLGPAGVLVGFGALFAGTVFSITSAVLSSKKRHRQLEKQKEQRKAQAELLTNPGNGRSYLLEDVDIDQETDEHLAEDIVAGGSRDDRRLNAQEFDEGIRAIGPRQETNKRYDYLLVSGYEDTEDGSVSVSEEAIRQMFRDGVLYRGNSKIRVDLTKMPHERLAKALWREAGSGENDPTSEELATKLRLINEDLSFDPKRRGKPRNQFSASSPNIDSAHSPSRSGLLLAAVYGGNAGFDDDGSARISREGIEAALKDGVLTFDQKGFFTVDRDAIPAEGLAGGMIAVGSKEETADWLGVQRGLQRLGFAEDLNDGEVRALNALFGDDTGPYARVSRDQLASMIKSGALRIEGRQADKDLTGADPDIVVRRLASRIIQLGPQGVAGKVDRTEFLDSLRQMGFEPTISDSRLDELFEDFGTEEKGVYKVGYDEIGKMLASLTLPTAAPLLLRTP